MAYIGGQESMVYCKRCGRQYDPVWEEECRYCGLRGGLEQ